jgi:hypothetical protein
MRTIWIAAAVALLVTVALPLAAEAGVPERSAVDVFRDFGLFGTWAVVCGKPPSVDNPRVTVALSDHNAVVEDHALGGTDMSNHYRILSARPISDTRLAVQVILNPGGKFEERQNLIMVVRDNTRRTVFNQAEDGEVHVKDGVALGFGLKTPLLRKCG